MNAFLGLGSLLNHRGLSRLGMDCCFQSGLSFSGGPGVSWGVGTWHGPAPQDLARKKKREEHEKEIEHLKEELQQKARPDEFLSLCRSSWVKTQDGRVRITTCGRAIPSPRKSEVT